MDLSYSENRYIEEECIPESIPSMAGNRKQLRLPYEASIFYKVDGSVAKQQCTSIMINESLPKIIFRK